MGIPSGVARLVLHGVTGGEIFETGMYVTPAPSSQADTQTMANSAWNSWLTAASGDWTAILTDDTAYTGLTAYSYPTGGPAAGFIAEAVASPAAGVGSGHLPLQTCLVLTTLTGAAGRANRGRMYLPAHGATLGVNHQFGNSTVDACTTALAGWIDALATATIDAVVVSSTNTSHRPITQSRGDSKPDIQRRRANKLVAAHTHTATV